MDRGAWQATIHGVTMELDTTEGLHFHFQTYIARQDSLSMEFPKQEYWSGLLFPPPGDLPK